MREWERGRLWEEKAVRRPDWCPAFPIPVPRGLEFQQDPKVLGLMSFQRREAVFFLFLQNRHHPSGAGFSGGTTSRPHGTRRGRRRGNHQAVKSTWSQVDTPALVIKQQIQQAQEDIPRPGKCMGFPCNHLRWLLLWEEVGEPMRRGSVSPKMPLLLSEENDVALNWEDWVFSTISRNGAS